MKHSVSGSSCAFLFDSPVVRAAFCSSVGNLMVVVDLLLSDIFVVISCAVWNCWRRSVKPSITVSLVPMARI